MNFQGFCRQAIGEHDSENPNLFWLVRHLDESHEDQPPNASGKAAVAYAIAIQSYKNSGGSEVNDHLVDLAMKAETIKELRSYISSF